MDRQCPLITPIAARNDNYAWLIEPAAAPAEGPQSTGRTPHAGSAVRGAIVVDPSESGPVIAALIQRGLRCEAVLVTHHHYDHTGGLPGLLAHPAGVGAAVYCSAYDFAKDRVAGATRGCTDAEPLQVLTLDIVPLSTPGHTAGGVCFYLPAAAAVFVGDTLFLGGCGRLLEGQAHELYASLQRLNGLPAATRVYCGHEYTEKNLAFAHSVLPADRAVIEALAVARRQRRAGEPTVPHTLAEERKTNLFLRTAESVVQVATETSTAAAAFACLRARRDDFRG